MNRVNSSGHFYQRTSVLQRKFHDREAVLMATLNDKTALECGNTELHEYWEKIVREGQIRAKRNQQVLLKLAKVEDHLSVLANKSNSLKKLRAQYEDVITSLQSLGGDHKLNDLPPSALRNNYTASTDSGFRSDIPKKFATTSIQTDLSGFCDACNKQYSSRIGTTTGLNANDLNWSLDDEKFRQRIANSPMKYPDNNYLKNAEEQRNENKHWAVLKNSLKTSKVDSGHFNKVAIEQISTEAANSLQDSPKVHKTSAESVNFHWAVLKNSIKSSNKADSGPENLNQIDHTILSEPENCLKGSPKAHTIVPEPENCPKGSPKAHTIVSEAENCLKGSPKTQTIVSEGENCLKGSAESASSATVVATESASSVAVESAHKAEMNYDDDDDDYEYEYKMGYRRKSKVEQEDVISSSSSEKESENEHITSSSEEEEPKKDDKQCNSATASLFDTSKGSNAYLALLSGNTQSAKLDSDEDDVAEAMFAATVMPNKNSKNMKSKSPISDENHKNQEKEKNMLKSPSISTEKSISAAERRRVQQKILKLGKDSDSDVEIPPPITKMNPAKPESDSDDFDFYG